MALAAALLPQLTAAPQPASSSPHARVQGIPLGEARWTSDFWFDRFENLRTNMLPNMGRLMSGTNYSHYLENFRIAAGEASGRSRGAPFNDGDFYKWMEAACAVLASRQDPRLEEQLDAIIAVMARAQRGDGYLHTPVLIRARQGDTNAVPFQNRHNFELYNLGHLFTTASAHYRVTGKTNLLAVARKAADYLDAIFREAPPEAARSSVCPSHYMGMVDLWRVTGEPRYLALVKKFFAQRSQISDGGDDNQDRIPFERQTEAVGHAVRANYLYAGAADLFIETGDASLWKPLEPIWTNVAFQKMHITGGCGALYDGASPDGSRDQRSITRTHQAYGRNYQLPNTTAHNETCANIGNVLWNWRMFLATGEARFIDVLELALYNSVLSGVSLGGTNFFYTNPLRVTDPLPAELRWPRARVSYVSSFCCPPNLLRTIAQSAQYAYGISQESIWVNLYGSSLLQTRLGGQAIELEQETQFPWNGRVRILHRSPGAREFTLKLRIPGWTGGAAVQVNRSPVRSGHPPSGQYLELRRVWQPGDEVELEFEMPVRLMEAHPLVEEALNQLAVQRGPLIYCLESIDLPAGTRPSEVMISPNADWKPRYDAQLLDGVVVLEGTLRAKSAGDWGHRLYREFNRTEWQAINARLIPYAFWGNRGTSEMTVWLPLREP